MRIKVDHQLQRTSQMEYVIQQPKIESGIRYVPMAEEVASCFHRIIANRAVSKTEPMVDGYVGFLFLDKNDMPMVALHWEKYLEHIVQKYNKIYRIQMPKVTSHVCRPTFCSNMAKSGMNPKTLQYIMGHADISVTLNTYNHVKFDDAIVGADEQVVIEHLKIVDHVGAEPQTALLSFDIQHHTGPAVGKHPQRSLLLGGKGLVPDGLDDVVERLDRIFLHRVLGRRASHKDDHDVAVGFPDAVSCFHAGHVGQADV